MTLFYDFLVLGLLGLASVCVVLAWDFDTMHVFPFILGISFYIYMTRYTKDLKFNPIFAPILVILFIICIPLYTIIQSLTDIALATALLSMAFCILVSIKLVPNGIKSIHNTNYFKQNKTNKYSN